MNQINLPYETKKLDEDYHNKIQYTKERIVEWYFYHRGGVVIAVSGGIDSLVLLHIVRKTIKEIFNKDVPGCFIDTGVEFLEIRNTVKEQDNIITLYPKIEGKRINFKDLVLKQNYFSNKKMAGYPFWSKVISMGISRYRNTKDIIQKGLRLNGGINPTSGKKQFPSIPKKFHNLAKKGKYPISEVCCKYLKKAPSHLMYKETGLAPYIGMKENDGRLRKQILNKTGCNAYDSKHPKSNPLRYWTDEDIKKYVSENNLKVCSLYNKGYDSTGCTGCTFGIAKDKDRFLRLKEYHPALYNFYINKLDYKGFFKEIYNLSGIKIKY